MNAPGAGERSGSMRPHPVGLFGYIDGTEVEFLSSADAGVFGVPVEYVTARREGVPKGTPEVSGGDRPPAGDVVRVPRSAVEGLARWTWTAVLDGREYPVHAVRDGRAAIETFDSGRVWGDEWDGNARDGWVRWVDIGELAVTAHRHPLRASGQES